MPQREYEKTLVVSVETIVGLHGLDPGAWREIDGNAMVEVVVVPRGYQAAVTGGGRRGAQATAPE